MLWPSFRTPTTLKCGGVVEITLLPWREAEETAPGKPLVLQGIFARKEPALGFRRDIDVASFLLIFQVLFLNQGGGYHTLTSPYTPRMLKLMFCSCACPHPYERTDCCVGTDPWLASGSTTLEISASDPRILPGVFAAALPDSTCTKRHLWPTLWLRLAG